MKFSNFQGWTKQVVSDDLNNEEKKILNLFFPLFSEWDEPTEQMKKDVEKNIELGAEFVYTKLSNSRRFAGDDFLGRGNYYSIADNKIGDDRFCLVNELKAYRDPTYGEVDILDSAIDNHYMQLTKILPFTPREHHLYIFVPDIHRYKGLPMSSNISFKLENNTRTSIYWLPYRVTFESISDCVDLRVPNTRDWFYKTFTNKSDKNFKQPYIRHIDSFLDMLPTLMFPEIGGGSNNGLGSKVYGIGCWMRLNGVSALIYPSARSDAGVQIVNGELAFFKGFNMVKYLYEPLPMDVNDPEAFIINDFSDWKNGFAEGIHISIPPKDLEKYKGSFQVVGIENFQDRFFKKRIKGNE